MKFGGPISRAGSSGSGVVCRSQGDWATSGFTPRVLSARCGNGVESCLVACNGWCGKETLVRTGKRPCSPSASLSPPPLQLLLHLCVWRQCSRSDRHRKNKSFFILCCISACPELRSGRVEKQKRENQSLEKFSFFLRGWGEASTRVHLLQRNTDFPSDQYLSLLANSVPYL